MVLYGRVSEDMNMIVSVVCLYIQVCVGDGTSCAA